MSNIDQNVINDEKIISRAKIHWILFYQALFLSIISIVILNYYLWVGQIGLIISLYLWLKSFIIYITHKFIITNKRIIIKTGFIRRDTFEIIFSKLESISVNQGILGNILGYGAITVTGSGGAKMTFFNIKSVKQFKNKIDSIR